MIVRQILPLMLVTFFVAGHAHAIPEDGYQETLENTVFPWAQSHSIEYIQGRDQKAIALLCFEKEGTSDAVLVSSGRTENIPKYLEVAYDLYHSGLNASVCLFDHRGQGLSDRLIDDTRKGYVKWFSDYAKDLKKVRDTIIDRGFQRVYLIGHSMGGGIAVYTAMMYPNAFDGMVLTAPMLAINTAPYPRSIAYSVAATLTFWWQGETFVLGGDYWTPTGSDEDFASNYVTRSRARWQMSEDLYLRYNDLYPQEPLGSATNRWLRESIRAGWWMKWNARKLKTPTLIMQAGDEKYVDNGAHDYVCNRATDCRTFSYSSDSFRDAEGNLPRHELWMEVDDIRNDVMNRALDFIETQQNGTCD